MVGFDLMNLAGASLALATVVSLITASGDANDDLLLLDSKFLPRGSQVNGALAWDEAMATGVIVFTVDIETGAGGIDRN